MDNLKEARGVVLGALAGAGVIAMAICVAMGFAGCAWVDEMTHRTAEPDTRADIGTSRIEFNAIGKRTGFGTTIDDYTCGTKLFPVLAVAKFPPQFRTGTPAKRARTPGPPGAPASRFAYPRDEVEEGIATIRGYDTAMREVLEARALGLEIPRPLRNGRPA